MIHVRIAVIGCGYIGGALAHALSQRGYDVIGTTTTPARVDQINALGARAAVLTLQDEAALVNVLHDCSAVVMTVAPARDDAGHREVYLEGMRHLLHVLPHTPVQHVLYTSSTSVYGQRDGNWVDEDSPTEPFAENGRILLQAERELLDYAARGGLTATLLRLAGIIGPGRGPAKRIPAWAGRSRTDGGGFVNLVHRDDIVTLCLRAIESTVAGIFNVSDGHPVRRADYYDRVIAALGLAPIRWDNSGGDRDLGKKISNQRACQQFQHVFCSAADSSVRDLRSGSGS